MDLVGIAVLLLEELGVVGRLCLEPAPDPGVLVGHQEGAAVAALHDVGGFMGQNFPVGIGVLGIKTVLADREPIDLFLLGIAVFASGALVLAVDVDDLRAAFFDEGLEIVDVDRGAGHGWCTEAACSDEESCLKSRVH